VLPDELAHSFRTEDQGRSVQVLPISRRLRGMIPFRSVGEVIEHLRANASDSGQRVAVMIDDAERFGAWPGTEGLPAQDGYLERLFSALEGETDWLTLTTPGEYTSTTPTRRLVYLPGGSYPEMGLWSLPAPYGRDMQDAQAALDRAGVLDRTQPFLRGGGWRNFLSRYPEVGQMHKRAMYVSGKVHSTARAGEAASLALWRAQTVAPYWQGMGGGFALNFLRHAVYKNLILAENSIEPRKYSWLDIEYHDMDMDGVPEVIAESNTLNVHFNAARGGMITELDFRPRAINLTDTLSRRPELYHPTTDASVARHGVRRPGPAPAHADIIYDAYERRSLIDHFIGAESTLDEFIEARYLELGDFTTGAFEASKYRNRVTLTREGSVRGPVGEPVPVEVKKAIRILPKEGKLEVEYRITNHGIVDIITRFGSEWGFGMLAGNAPDRYYTIEGRKAGPLNGVAEDRAVTRAGLVDEWQGVQVEFDFEGREVLLWRHPVETLSQVGGGTLQKLYQSSVMLPLWDLDLPVGRSRRVAYSVRIRER
ncbi:MAG TPA: alpha-amylase/4-alpha-glucanotransferase domain-containing protein, partial [Deinococcales bacterium]|nr:alpha-amylase/4-alpha-glucanotransferase domain-containing protein [Deinococcales bacterium]